MPKPSNRLASTSLASLSLRIFLAHKLLATLKTGKNFAPLPRLKIEGEMRHPVHQYTAQGLPCMTNGVEGVRSLKWGVRGGEKNGLTCCPDLIFQGFSSPQTCSKRFQTTFRFLLGAKANLRYPVTVQCMPGWKSQQCSPAVRVGGAQWGGGG